MDDKGNAPLLETIDLKKYFKVGGGTLHAVDSINIKLYQGETLGVVGESGCGKSTLGKAICAIPLPQCVILLCVFTAGRLLSGALTPEMFADLSACGGVLTMSAGFRVSKIKSVPLVDLMPALILVMPFSALWTMLMG